MGQKPARFARKGARCRPEYSLLSDVWQPCRRRYQSLRIQPTSPVWDIRVQPSSRVEGELSPSSIQPINPWIPVGDIRVQPSSRVEEELSPSSIQPSTSSPVGATVSSKGRKRRSVRKTKRCKNRRTKAKHTEEPWLCTVCHFTYGDENDKHITDVWLEWVTCHRKFHETCGEQFGIVDDDGTLTCKDCLWSVFLLTIFFRLRIAVLTFVLF